MGHERLLALLILGLTAADLWGQSGSPPNSNAGPATPQAGTRFPGTRAGTGMTPNRIPESPLLRAYFTPYPVYFYPAPIILYPTPVPVPTPYPYPYPVGVPFAAQPPPAAPPAGPARPPAAAPAEAPPAPKPQADDLQPRIDMQQALRAGNDAFAEGKYQQALAQYNRAAAAAPLEPLPLFHQAQAHLALGRYAQAAVAVQRGLRLHPTWASSGFQPKALYQDRAGEYAQHLASLAAVLAKNPNDDGLLLLLGYQLWFDGRQDEAVILLKRAAALVLDPTLIDRFLKAAQAPAAAKP
jgi:hypothetical protein